MNTTKEHPLDAPEAELWVKASGSYRDESGKVWTFEEWQDRRRENAEADAKKKKDAQAQLSEFFKDGENCRCELCEHPVRKIWEGTK